MRVNVWESRLADYLESCRAKRFRYGVNDCCTFAAGAVRVLTGRDPMQNLPRYYGVREARGLVRKLGGLEKAVSDVMAENGYAEIPPSRSSRGDLVFADFGRPSVGVNVDGYHIAFISARQLLHIPAPSCLRAWRIE